MIEKDKTYTYKELMDIVAEASAKAASNANDSLKETMLKAMMYAELMAILFDDEELNEEFYKEQKEKEN